MRLTFVDWLICCVWWGPAAPVAIHKPPLIVVHPGMFGVASPLACFWEVGGKQRNHMGMGRTCKIPHAHGDWRYKALTKHQSHFSQPL